MRIALAMLLAVLASTAPAHGATKDVPLGFAQDTGTYPSTFFFSEEVERVVAFTIDYTGEPAQTFNTRYTITCVRGSARIEDEKKSTMTPPLFVEVPATLRNSDSCSINVEAEAATLSDFDADPIPGTIRIDVSARVATERASPWRTCSPPARGFYRRVRAKWTSCAVARRILTRGKCQNLPRCSRFRYGPWRCRVRGSIVKRTIRCHHGRKRIVARASGD